MISEVKKKLQHQHPESPENLLRPNAKLQEEDHNQQDSWELQGAWAMDIWQWYCFIPLMEGIRLTTCKYKTL